MISYFDFTFKLFLIQVLCTCSSSGTLLLVDKEKNQYMYVQFNIKGKKNVFSNACKNSW